MNNLIASASPHITKKENTTRSIMLDVVIALMPVLVAATYFFGWQVLINTLVCVSACFGFELLYSLIVKKDFSQKSVKTSSCWDLSCIVTGIILALNLPARTVVPGWDVNIYAGQAAGVRRFDSMIFSFDAVFLCLIGSLVAIVLVKMLFGGIGKNFANPACTARVFLLLAFGLSVVQSAGAGIAASSGATWLSGADPANGIKYTNDRSMFLNMFLGNRGTSAVGETSMIALLLGYAYLSVRKVIDFRLPLIIVAAAAVFALLFDGLLATYLNTGKVLGGARLINNMFAHVMSGGLVFGAVFMATDYSTSPNTFLGSALFGVGIALFTVLIRVFTGMPEGMSFAILVMNVTVPLIDKYIVPKPFGAVRVPRVKKGAPHISDMSLQKRNTDAGSVTANGEGK